MDAKWLETVPALKVDLTDTQTFLRMLRNEYCKEVRAGVFAETVPAMKPIAAADGESGTCLSTKNTKVLENLILEGLAEKQYLANFVAWQTLGLEKPDDQFDLSCTATTTFYLD